MAGKVRFRLKPIYCYCKCADYALIGSSYLKMDTTNIGYLMCESITIRSLFSL